jgi:hypothetical protein
MAHKMDIISKFAHDYVHNNQDVSRFTSDIVDSLVETINTHLRSLGYKGDDADVKPSVVRKQLQEARRFQSL